MRLALLADLHGNLEALRAVLTDVRAEAVDQIVCLGDLVGYGPDPAAVVELIASLVDDGALCVRGNHDEAIETGIRGMSESAATAIEWTVSHLGADHRAFLKSLPMACEVGEVLCVHASADRPAEWTYVVSATEAAASMHATTASVTVCGHTHVPAHYSLLHGFAGTTGKIVPFRPAAGKPVPLSRVRQHLAVMGAVGQPRDGDPRAAWGLLDLDVRELTWRRVPYDNETTMRKIKDVGLPIRLAERLKEGR